MTPAAPLLFTPIARQLPATVPFVGPEAIERRSGTRFLARLGANESTFGPSPLALEAMRAAAGESWAYADPELFDVKAAIAQRLGLAPGHVAVGEGIDGLLGNLVHLAVGPGDAVVTSLGAYPTFNFHVAGRGGVLHAVPYREDREDLDALLDASLRLRPKLVYLANPDNPTGSWHGAEAVVDFARALPEETILVLDEAYGDMAPAGVLPASDLLRPNLLRFRTFSKAYGMAGVRIGFVFGRPETVVAFDKVRNHFGVSRMAQAGAIAALADDAHLHATLDLIERARLVLAEIAAQAGLRALPSATNFVAIDAGRDGTYAARLLEGVIRRGVFIRKPQVAPLDRLIRVTVGRSEELALFRTALLETVAELG
ncbi:histidinol-phosphate aminotransferase [Aureimonas sp. Leaf454]|uniref:pyridoxal phosphate-dependent aminotransferase n=1 Tax=Aureimonas sp. Leaf454 TaxID=1736381 RepID=UPI0006FEAEBD|nr:pyridoxal phosphate-dependent aminotransferase [Aureimonas sp. Leaf454]KQT54220.1 histidinol-phosphate aminotransferase [Aureimonas sp. Leaf454]